MRVERVKGQIQIIDGANAWAGTVELAAVDFPGIDFSIRGGLPFAIYDDTFADRSPANYSHDGNGNTKDIAWDPKIIALAKARLPAAVAALNLRNAPTPEQQKADELEKAFPLAKFAPALIEIAATLPPEATPELQKLATQLADAAVQAEGITLRSVK